MKSKDRILRFPCENVVERESAFPGGQTRVFCRIYALPFETEEIRALQPYVEVELSEGSNPQEYMVWGAEVEEGKMRTPSIRTGAMFVAELLNQLPRGVKLLPIADKPGAYLLEGNFAFDDLGNAAVKILGLEV